MWWRVFTFDQKSAGHVCVIQDTEVTKDEGGWGWREKYLVGVVVLLLFLNLLLLILEDSLRGSLSDLDVSSLPSRELCGGIESRGLCKT